VGFPLQAGGTPLPDLFDRLQKKGFRRLLVHGEAVEIPSLPPDFSANGGLVVVVDRVTIDEAARSRVSESVETAFGEGGGLAVVQVLGGPFLHFSERFECAHCARPFEEPQPRLFSFNNPFGACATCHGFGNLIEIAEDLVVPDGGKSLAGGAIEPWNRPHYRPLLAELERFCKRRGISTERPWSALPEEHRRAVLEGDEEFRGIVGFFRWLETKKYKVQVRVFLSRYRGYEVCPACHGSRLRPEALIPRVGGRNIDEVCRLSVKEARTYLSELALSGAERLVSAPVISELLRRLGFLCDVGLDYLTLDRPFGSLSGGEAQRIALATALGTGLVGTLYVLDEPSIGLHPSDTSRLLEILKGLRDQGNTVVVVEHDHSVMKAADYVLDLGPGAGDQGGRLVFSGTYPELMRDGRSLTGKFLRAEIQVPLPQKRRRGNGLALEVRGARAHNLKGIDVRIPLGVLTCVTGVSGSGKSTLVHDVVCAALLKRKERWDRSVGAHDALLGAQFVDEVVIVDQSPIGRTPRSNPVTHIKAFDPIRELFARAPDAQRLGLNPSHFSFNVPGGRCETCAGDGQVKVDMQFLADVYLVCETCGGRRYKPSVLEARYRGKTIDQVLDLTVREALQFFAGQPRVARRLKAFELIGLSYLRLGQPATTLSGGEAQRVKLASHLLRRPGERVLYVLDEPTTGLHMADVAELLSCFARLVDAGASLLVIEHNMEVVKQADWVIDLGPGGGAEEGGRLVFQGAPEALARHTGGLTARYLRQALQGTARPAASASR
jgi:excinuclease ABC subunit A